MTQPRCLIGCEESGRMRRAFARRGWDARSCDFQPARDGSNQHIIGDVRDQLHLDWDLIVICHPPCTRLCLSGLRWLTGPGGTPPKTLPRGRTHESLLAELDDAADLFTACWNANAPHVAIENPKMHHMAKARLPATLPAPQIVQPWWFGDAAFKGTGFYTRGLPPLRPTNRLTPPRPGTEAHKAWSHIHRQPPGPDRAKIRSETFPGVAEACADQWGGYVMERIAA